MKRLLNFTMAMALLAPWSGGAVEVADLYQSSVPVASQGGEERKAATRTALAGVLVKVTGDGKVAGQPAVIPLIERADQFVERLQYQASGAEPGAAQTLEIQFDRHQLQQALYQARAPIWGRNRPLTVVWIAVEEQGRRALAGGDNYAALQSMIQSQARRRGLPVAVPLLDLQDQSSLRVADVWGDFHEVITAASGRYSGDASLVGRAWRESSGEWRARWSLYQPDGAVSWEARDANPADLAASAIDAVADGYARQYALLYSPDASDTARVVVSGVDTLDSYARALTYLRSLELVADAQAARVEKDEVEYLVRIRGTPEGLRQIIALGRALVPVEPGAQDAPPAGLQYRLAP